MPDDPERFTPRADERPHDAAWGTLSWPPRAGAVLAGSSVRLTPVDPARDADDLYAALDHDAVWAHVAGRPASADHHREALESALAAGRLPWTVRLVTAVGGLPAGAVVGTSSYLDVSVPDARLEIGSTMYTPAVWATRVNPESKLLLLAHAFEALGAGRVQLKTDIRNVRSQQAIARLGARYEGTLRRYQRRADGTVRDTVLFSITAEEWPEVRGRLEGRLAGA
jgi:RimJ/RimL family protein N-acetyltransferase